MKSHNPRLAGGNVRLKNSSNHSSSLSTYLLNEIKESNRKITVGERVSFVSGTHVLSLF